MPTYLVTAPPDTPLGPEIADSEAEALALALEEHPEYDALSGLSAEKVSDDPPADSFTVWQTHGADGEPLGHLDADRVFQPRPVETFSSGSLAVAIDGVQLLVARGEAGFLVRQSDGATMDQGGEWTEAKAPAGDVSK